MARIWKLSGPRSRGTNPLNIVQAVECVDDVTGQPVIDPRTGKAAKLILSAFDIDAAAITRVCKDADRDLAGSIANEAIRNAAEASIDALAAAGGVIDTSVTKEESDLSAAQTAYSIAMRKLTALQVEVDTRVITNTDPSYVAAITAAKAARTALEAARTR